jgi:hypothetical protein
VPVRTTSRQFSGEASAHADNGINISNASKRYKLIVQRPSKRRIHAAAETALIADDL